MPNFAAGPLRKSKAERHYAPMLPRLIDLIDKGYNQVETADILTREGFRTLSGSPIHQVCVSRWLKVARRKQAQGKVTATAAGATLAKQANIEAHEMTLDDYVMQVAREEKAKLDREVELMKQHQPDPRIEWLM